MSLSLARMSKAISSLITFDNITFQIYTKLEVASFNNLQLKFKELLEEQGFSLKLNELDFILCFKSKGEPVSFLVLREYFYTPCTKKKWIHVEYGVTIEEYEGFGMSSELRRICLAFAYEKGYGGVSSFAISYGSQIPLKRLGFKIMTPMTYVLSMNNNQKKEFSNRIKKEGWKLNPKRELYYKLQIAKAKQIRKIQRPLLSLLSTSHERSQIAQSRLKVLQNQYLENKAFVTQLNTNIQNQYFAEIMKKWMPQETRKQKLLGNGMVPQTIFENIGCPMSNARKFRPYISHVFTFASQQPTLQNITNDIRVAFELEKTKTSKSFAPKVTIKKSKSKKFRTFR